jgi:hypothetical protein
MMRVYPICTYLTYDPCSFYPSIYPHVGHAHAIRIGAAHRRHLGGLVARLRGHQNRSERWQ